MIAVGMAVGMETPTPPPPSPSPAELGEMFVVVTDLREAWRHGSFAVVHRRRAKVSERENLVKHSLVGPLGHERDVTRGVPLVVGLSLGVASGSFVCYSRGARVKHKILIFTSFETVLKPAARLFKPKEG